MDWYQNSAAWFFTVITAIASIFLAIASRKRTVAFAQIKDGSTIESVAKTRKTLLWFYRLASLSYGIQAIGLAVVGLGIFSSPLTASFFPPAFFAVWYMIGFYLTWSWSLFMLGVGFSILSYLTLAQLKAVQVESQSNESAASD